MKTIKIVNTTGSGIYGANAEALKIWLKDRKAEENTSKTHWGEYEIDLGDFIPEKKKFDTLIGIEGISIELLPTKSSEVKTVIIDGLRISSWMEEIKYNMTHSNWIMVIRFIESQEIKTWKLHDSGKIEIEGWINSQIEKDFRDEAFGLYPRQAFRTIMDKCK